MHGQKLAGYILSPQLIEITFNNNNIVMKEKMTIDVGWVNAMFLSWFIVIDGKYRRLDLLVEL